MARGGKVDDGQSPMTKRDAFLRPDVRARVVGAAVAQRGRHARDGRLVDRERVVKGEDASDSAHARQPL